MQETPVIIETGRGPQLSTCRITVQDVFPYLEWSNDRIREILPVLQDDEIESIRGYVAKHLSEVIAQDRTIRARSIARQTAPEAEAEREAIRKRMAARRAARSN